MIRTRLYTLLLTSAIAALALAAEPVYDERADAARDVQAAIARAAEAGAPGKSVVLVFGANWCPDCRVLDARMHEGDLATLLARSFVVVKIDVGRMDKNLDIAARYNVPLKHGIPVLAVLDPRGKLLYAQDQGQFADARHMSYQSIRAFFEEWKPKG